jgi:hypothetical protein
MDFLTENSVQVHYTERTLPCRVCARPAPVRRRAIVRVKAKPVHLTLVVGNFWIVGCPVRTAAHTI